MQMRKPCRGQLSRSSPRLRVLLAIKPQGPSQQQALKLRIKRQQDKDKQLSQLERTLQVKLKVLRLLEVLQALIKGKLRKE